MIIDGWLPENSQEERFGIQVQSFESVRKIYSDEVIVVISSMRYRQEICRLVENEMPKWRTFSFVYSLNILQKDIGAERKEYYLGYLEELDELRAELYDEFSKKILDCSTKGSISNNPDWCCLVGTIYQNGY